MTKIVVLFNLKPGVSVEAYERFARDTDLPIVDTEQLIGWTADWVAQSMPSLGKPTKYEVRDGRY